MILRAFVPNSTQMGFEILFILFVEFCWEFCLNFTTIMMAPWAIKMNMYLPIISKLALKINTGLARTEIENLEVYYQMWG